MKTAVRTTMTYEEALALFGLEASFSPQQLKDAYRKKSLETHPDRNGGDDAKFKEVGTALGVLQGEITPSYDYRRTPTPQPPPPSYSTSVTQRAPQKKKEVTFEEAKSKAGIPSGVEWAFVTPRQRGTSYNSDEFSRGDATFVAYGKTASQHVFVVARHTTYAEMFIGGGAGEDVWAMKSFEYPIKAEEGKNPAWLYGNVVKALKDIGFKGKFNSKVVDAAGWTFNERLPSGPEVSTKHWLVNSGQVAGDAASVAGRKQVVEFMVHRTMRQEKSGFYPEPPGTPMYWDGSYHGDYYKLTLVINGKPHELNEVDTTKFLGLKGGLNLIFGTYYYDGSKKVLTRMPKGKKILTWMAEHFKGLPDDAQQALKAAADQMKG